METDAATGRMHAPAVDRLLDVAGASVLVTGEPEVERIDLLCEAVESAHETGRDVAVVTAGRGYRSLSKRLPEEVGVVDCTPSPAVDAENVYHVGSPADLTGVSMPLSEFFENAAPRPVLAIDSLSTMLVYGEESALFRFLSATTAQLRATGGAGVVGMSAEAHDEQTLKTFQQLFDGRARVDDETVAFDGL